MAHVFISYAHVDREFARALKDEVSVAGFEVWLDAERLRVGEDWREGIDNALRNAFVMIVVMTPKAAASQYVTYEWAFALGIGLRVIPLLLKPAKLHPRLEALQFLDFTRNSATDDHPWEELIRILGVFQAEHDNTGIGDPGIKSLLRDLQNSKPVTRRNAAQTLGELRARQAVDSLITLLEGDKSWPVRREAAAALGHIGDPAALPPLINALHSEGSYRVRQNIVWSLGEIGEAAAVPTLAEHAVTASEAKEDVRAAAIDALGKIGDAAAVAGLLGAAQDANNGKNLHAAAVEMLENIGTPEALDALRQIGAE